MLALAALVSAFILVGLLVLGVAFASRRKPAGTSPSRESNRLLYAGVLIVCVGIGLALPLLMLVKNADSADTKAVGGVDLTAAQAHGRELFAQNCATCHTLQASNSVGKIGPNLDVLRPPAALVTNAIQIGRARGNGNMPALLLRGEDAKDVASYIEAVAGRGEGVKSDPVTTTGG